MISTGISIYAGLKEYNKEKNTAYLHLAKECGCEYVFSSAHINEAKTSAVELQEIIDQSLKLGMKLSLDVSKPIMNKITIPTGLFALRLDYGFTDEEIIEMSHNAPYFVELNASTLSKEHIEKLIREGINCSRTRFSFNFYPKLYTGHDLIDVKSKTEILKEKNIEVCAFIPSHIGFRPPMYEGLPTVESHRKCRLELAIEELKAIGVDGIYFGDAYASEDELKLLNKLNTDYLNIILKLNKEFACIEKELDEIYRVRPDLNSYILRIGNTRKNDMIQGLNQIKRSLYDVTIDNSLFKRYAGEINICLTDLPIDERVNVIGKLDTSLTILEALKKGYKFKFIIEKREE